MRCFFRMDGSSIELGEVFSFLRQSRRLVTDTVEEKVVVVVVPAGFLRFGCHSDLGSLFLCVVSVLSQWLISVSVNVPRSLRFITPGALDVVLRFVGSLASLGGEPATPPMAESTLVRFDVSADMMECDDNLNQMVVVSR